MKNYYKDYKYYKERKEEWNTLYGGKYGQYRKEFMCYWGTWCVMVLNRDPFRPKYKDYIQYQLACVKAGVNFEKLEQARKNPNKVQTGVTYEYFDYDTLYYCNIYKIADKYDILDDYKFYRKEDAEDCIKKELKKKFPDEEFRVIEIQRKYTR